jgi:hypothetical protein
MLTSIVESHFDLIQILLAEFELAFLVDQIFQKTDFTTLANRIEFESSH